MKKDIKFSTRMASADREKIRALAARAHMSMNDYVTACCLGKRIVVIDEQKELLRQPQRGGVGDFYLHEHLPRLQQRFAPRAAAQIQRLSAPEYLTVQRQAQRGVSPSLP